LTRTLPSIENPFPRLHSQQMCNKRCFAVSSCRCWF